MKNIEGYVCIAKPRNRPGTAMLYGRNVTGGNIHYQNFEWNGMTTYPTRKDAKLGLGDLKQKENIFAGVNLGHIVIRLADKTDDLLNLKSEKSFIVVASAVEKGEDLWRRVVLYGRRVEGRIGFDSRAELFDNGLQPFINERVESTKVVDIVHPAYTRTAYEQAIHAAEETVRQYGARATIAAFNLKKVRS